MLLLHGGAHLESASLVLEVVSLDSVLFLRGVTCLGLALLVLGAVSMGSLPPLHSVCHLDPFLLMVEAASLGFFLLLHGSARPGLALLVLDLVESDLSPLVRGVS